MYNIFSTLPLDTMIQFHVGENKTSYIEEVEFFILRYLPLWIEEESINSIGTPDKMRKYFQKRVRDKTPVQIAQYTLELCANYLDYRKYLTVDSFFLNDGRLKSMVSLERNAFLYMIESFYAELYDKKEQEDEFTQFLILSHYYIHSHTPQDRPAYMEKQDWSCIINNQAPKTGLTSNGLYRKIDDFMDKNPLFYTAFLAMDNLFGIDNTGESKTKSQSFHLRSIIDISILTGILSSAAYSKNAFVLNREEIGGYKINLWNFLQLFNRLFTSNPNKESIIFNHHSSKYYTSKVAYVYDQYILERLTGINYINYLHKLILLKTLPEPTINSLEMLIISPLPYFRFHLLKIHDVYVAKQLENHPELVSLWSIYLENLIKFQVMCSLPIIDYIFHYLMALQSIEKKGYNKDYEKHYFTNMMNYISSLSNTDKLSFYTKDENDDLTPNKYPFLLNKSKMNSIYAERCPLVYLNFFDSIVKMRMNNLLSFNGINALRSTITNSTISFLTNTLPSLTDNIV